VSGHTGGEPLTKDGDPIVTVEGVSLGADEFEVQVRACDAKDIAVRLSQTPLGVELANPIDGSFELRTSGDDSSKVRAINCLRAQRLAQQLLDRIHSPIVLPAADKCQRTRSVRTRPFASRRPAELAIGRSAHGNAHTMRHRMFDPTWVEAPLDIRDWK
jgi:hypothetical protein